MMTHDEIDSLLEGLDADAASDVQLEDVVTGSSDRPLCRARCGARWAYVNRMLARDLRQLGAVWRGDLLRDPCAVA